MQQRISKDYELSHDGCDGDLGGFSRSGHCLIFGFHVGVVACGNEGWHVKGLAQDSASAADVALASVLSVVAGLQR